MLSVQSIYLNAIQKGLKLKEGRLFSGIAASLSVGDPLIFVNGQDSIDTRVIRVTKYAHFKEMLETEGVESMLPQDGISLTEAVDIYQSFPGYKEKEQWFQTPVSIFQSLPSSSVWCTGNERDNRVCRFQNLCYSPNDSQWFITRTRESIIHIPGDNQDALLDLTTVQNHNLYYFWYTEALSSAFQRVPVRYETQRHYIFGRLIHDNNMHALHDDAFGLWMLMTEYEKTLTHEPFSRNHRLLAFDKYTNGPNSEALQYLSHYPIRYKPYLHQGVITCFKDAIVGNRKSLTWYQYGFSGFQGPIHNKTVNGHTIRRITQWYKSNLKKPLVNGPDVIVLLERTRNRLILNQNEFILALEAQFNMPVIVVSNEKHSFEEQVIWMHRAKMVIGMHGSILIMTVFCRPGTIVLELFPFGVPAKDYTPYKTMAGLKGVDLNYIAWENKRESDSVGHPHAEPRYGGLGHLSAQEREWVLQNKTVPQSICCASPYWLYRIYQDTKVNIPEILHLLSKSIHQPVDVNNDIEVPLTIPTQIQCVAENKRPGELWVQWGPLFNGAIPTQWEVHIETTKIAFATTGMELRHDGYAPGTRVALYIRALRNQTIGPFSHRIECIV